MPPHRAAEATHRIMSAWSKSRLCPPTTQCEEPRETRSTNPVVEHRRETRHVQQVLDAWMHVDELQLTACRSRRDVGSEDIAETARIDEINVAQIGHHVQEMGRETLHLRFEQTAGLNSQAPV